MAQKQLPIHVNDFADTLKTESDRGCVLIACHVLDAALEHLLRSNLSRQRTVMKQAVGPLFVNMGPLSSFSAKIKLAYALRLICDWAYEDLETIRSIRNAIAHSHASFSFESVDIETLLYRMKSPRRALGHPNIWSVARTLKGCAKYTDEFSPKVGSLKQAFFVAGFHYLHGQITHGKAYKTRVADLDVAKNSK